MDKKIFQLFSKVVVTDFLNISEQERLKILNILKEISYHKAGTDSGEDNLPLSSDDNYLLDMPELNFLKHKIEQYVNDFMHNEMKYNENNFKLTTSWVAKTLPGNISHWHNHNNCFYSGVLYIDTVEDSGEIKFTTFENRRNNLIVSEYNELNSVEFYVFPNNCRIILFPAEVYHQVAKNNSKQDRYSIAFNIIPTGVIGRGDSQLKRYD